MAESPKGKVSCRQRARGLAGARRWRVKSEPRVWYRRGIRRFEQRHSNAKPTTSECFSKKGSGCVQADGLGREKFRQAGNPIEVTKNCPRLGQGRSGGTG
jgi:hypothetical protein